MAVDPQTFKAVMGQWPSGVTVVTTVDADGPAGMTASSFSSVSLAPPLVSVCIARNLSMHARLSRAGVFAVNILRKDNVEHGQRFAGMLPGVTDRFQGLAVTRAATGAPLLPGTLGWVDCRVWATYDGGDHTIFVGEVLAAGHDDTASPLVYHSRAWGQFADVLARSVTLLQAGREEGAIVVERAFGGDADRPASLDSILARVRSALADAPANTMLVLDDAPGAADPLLTRTVIQGIASLVGRRPVSLRLAAGPMALANVVVALKSGVRHLSISPAGGRYLPESQVRDMLARMGVAAGP